jgi:spermidine synthase
VTSRGTPLNERPLLARIHLPFLHLLFAISGACALIYQLAWVRYFALEFGSTTLAIATVIAVFMGGLAIGAVWGGQLGMRSRMPLRTYAWIELSLTGLVLISPIVFPSILILIALAVSGAVDSFGLLTASRFLAAVFLILPPTILMGATLPVLTAWLGEQFGEGTLRATTLYAWNTIGATLGVLAGGFFLLPQYGVHATIWLAGTANLFVAVSCFLLSIGRPTAQAKRVVGVRIFDPLRDPLVKAAQDAIPWMVGAAVALAAMATMASQVVWTRVAALVLGASIYAFSVVLVVFLAGMGAGALAVSWWLGRRPIDARRGFVLLASLSAAVLLATGYLFPFLPVWAAWLYHALDLQNNPGSVFHLQFIVMAALLLPPTILFGGLLPAAFRAFAGGGSAVSRDVGQLYAWDVLGSIAGVLLAGFFLLPQMGSINSLLVASTLLLVAVLLVQLSGGIRAGLVSLAVIVSACAVLWAVAPGWDRYLMSSGVHSYAAHFGSGHTPRTLSQELSSRSELLFYAEGLTSTITVSREAGGADPPLLIATNGKTDGSSYHDMATQRLAAHLPLLLHPEPREIAIIGMGTGSTAGSAALHPESRVRVIEIEARMIEGARFFHEHNHGVHERENVEIHVADGRMHLLRARGHYDVVISVPSNPWLAGSSDLFTADFFARAAGAIKPDGVFAQWIQTYDMSPESFRMVLRGFVAAFPEAILATTARYSDVLLIGAHRPIQVDMDDLRNRMQQPVIAADLADPRVRVESIHDLLARVRVTRLPLRQLAGTGELHTDNRPLLAYRAPLELGRRNAHIENDKIIAAVATGIAPIVNFGDSSREGRIVELEELEKAQRRLLGSGREAAVTRSLINRMVSSPSSSEILD